MLYVGHSHGHDWYLDYGRNTYFRDYSIHTNTYHDHKQEAPGDIKKRIEDWEKIGLIEEKFWCWWIT